MPPTDAPASRPRARTIGLLLATLLAACQAPAPPPLVPATPPAIVPPAAPCAPARDAQDLATRRLLESQDHLATLPAADIAALAARPSAGAAPDLLLTQALALTLTHQPGDLAHAQALVDGVLHDPSPQSEPWRPIARLLAPRLADQRRAEDALERAALQLRDQQRDSQRRVDQLNEKLEALKAIERNLKTRPAQKETP